MSKILKFQSPGSLALLALSALALAACDSGTSNAAPKADAKTGSMKAAPAADWTTTVVATPEGGFRMGNPDASVKIVEFASFTCSHCRDFHLEGAEPLKNTYVKGGKVSYEYRPFLLNIYDFAAVLVAKCEGPAQFFTWANELYSNHDAWVTPFTKLTEADIAPLKSLPADQQIKGLAVAGGMHDFVKPRGMPRAKFEQCLADPKAMERLTASQKAAVDTYQIAGTPTFLLNGKKLEIAPNWAALQPKLDEALR